MLPTITVDQCREYLEPYHETFHDIMTEAVALFEALPADDRRIFAAVPRVKANVISAYMRDLAVTKFSQRSEVQLRTTYGSTTLEPPGQVEVRLKKLTRKGMSRNHTTTRSLQYNNVYSYALQYEIFSNLYAVPIRVDAGYVLDTLGISVASVMVVMRSGGKIVFSYDIERGDTNTHAATPLLPIVDTPHDAARVVAKGKKAVRKDGTNHSTGDNP